MPVPHWPEEGSDPRLNRRYGAQGRVCCSWQLSCHDGRGDGAAPMSFDSFGIELQRLPGVITRDRAARRMAEMAALGRHVNRYDPVLLQETEPHALTPASTIKSVR